MIVVVEHHKLERALIGIKLHCKPESLARRDAPVLAALKHENWSADGAWPLLGRPLSQCFLRIIAIARDLLGSTGAAPVPLSPESIVMKSGALSEPRRLISSHRVSSQP